MGDYEVVIGHTIGITDRLGYQHVLSISPTDENIVQQLSAPRPMVPPRGLLPRRKAEEGAGVCSMDAPEIAALADAGLCFHPETRSKELGCDLGDLLRRWLDNSPPLHPQDEAPTSNSQKAPSIISSAMPMDASREAHPEICIAYRTDGNLLNSRHMQAPMRVSTNRVRDLLFADDCAVNTVTEEDL
ncbi:unnamed protein product [Schistocephalus solidus]|uniref:Uncharacterized protein n=1 Tax=Schistocephalus solidus TaxID=70667 RepID=A0A3P7F5M6_SCHSO|nr:unnamed protein product [Schistocephalus solidus]